MEAQVQISCPSATGDETLILKNEGPRDLINHIATAGIPLRKGTAWRVEQLTFFEHEGQPIEAAITAQTLWPDGSIKWLQAKLLVSLKSKQSVRVLLVNANKVQFQAQKLPVEDKANSLVLTAASQTIEIDKRRLLNISTPTIKSSGLDFCFPAQQSADESNVNTSFSAYRSNSRYISAEIVQTARVLTKDDKCLDLVATITCNLVNNDIQMALTVSNPAAALHPDGKWDLGDPNSIDINAVNWIVIPRAEEQSLSVRSEPDAEWHLCDSTAVLHQASSGQASWSSPIHVNKHNKVTLPFRGYRLSINDELFEEGETASPCIRLTSDNHTDYITPHLFWQNFPSEATINTSKTAISLLGASSSDAVELQPGEQKTRAWSLSCNDMGNTQVKIEYAPAYMASTHTIPCLYDSYQNTDFLALINAAIEDEKGFDHKNRSVDMYGWRHFGELYADHERALSKDADYFISHYNNQYDPIYGMLLQWLKTGNSDWFRLADNLAKHVADIDVYHTSDDKPEYSGGLFWHTDHYVQAYTATHRTYSANQPSNVYDDHAGGGGPGGQHCYTQGLTLHYLLTGHQPSKQAVMMLCKWIENVYDGDNTLVALALAFKNRHRQDLKNIITGQYPLDRGTANYINALLDGYELTGKPDYLDKAQHVVLNTFSAQDNLAQRNLSDVENTWFYTVFCQAVCRYLSLAQSHSSTTPSKATVNIIHSLLHYGDWMLNHEYLYLDKPDILEFPNQTWTAQDCRKICVMSFVNAFLPTDKQQECREKIASFKKQILARLSASEDAKTTRVLCLLMQNTQFADYERMGQACFNWSRSSLGDVEYSFKKETLSTAIMRTLRQFSLRRERRQLVRRFPQLQTFLGKPNHG